MTTNTAGLPATRTLELDALTLDPSTRARASLDEDAVARLARSMRWNDEIGLVVDARGSSFAPLDAVTDGESVWVADGFHRVHAALAAGIERFQVSLQEGSQRDAVTFSLSANRDEKRRRTNLDKRHNIERALRDNDWCAWSDARIARLCAVSTPTVGKIRKQLEADGVILPQDVRRGADGRLYPRASSQRSLAGSASARVRKRRSSNRTRKRHARDPLHRAERFDSLGALLAAQPEGSPSLDALIVELLDGSAWDDIVSSLDSTLSPRGVLVAPNSPTLPAIMAIMANTLPYRGCFFAKSSSTTFHVWSLHTIDLITSGKRLGDLLRASCPKLQRLAVLT